MEINGNAQKLVGLLDRLKIANEKSRIGDMSESLLDEMEIICRDVFLLFCNCYGRLRQTMDFMEVLYQV